MTEQILVWVRFTADRITEESAAEGMAAESGWIDPIRARDIRPNREDVAPYGFSSREEAVEWVESVIGAIETGNYVTYYGVDAQQDMETGDYWMYAAHLSEGSI